MLVYEATRDAPVQEITVRTPVATTTDVRLSSPPLLVPVLRAGLGMAEQAHALIPEARMGFVGTARDEVTHQPVPYLKSLPDDLAGTRVFVLDPMIATGGSMASTIGRLTDRSATDVTAIGALAAPRRHRLPRRGQRRHPPDHRQRRRTAQLARIHRAGTR